MSRIGKNPIPIPNGVKVEVEGTIVKVEGPKGKLERVFSDLIQVEVGDGQVVVKRSSDKKFHKSLHGTTRAIINNMIVGVSAGFTKELVISGVGYKAQLQGRTLVLHLGFSHPVTFESPQGVDLELLNPTHIKVSGIDKELVGLVSAKIRSFRPPDPYKIKGIRYADEVVRKKAGKRAV